MGASNGVIASPYYSRLNQFNGTNFNGAYNRLPFGGLPLGICQPSPFPLCSSVINLPSPPLLPLQHQICRPILPCLPICQPQQVLPVCPPQVVPLYPPSQVFPLCTPICQPQQCLPLCSTSQYLPICPPQQCLPVCPPQPYLPVSSTPQFSSPGGIMPIQFPTVLPALPALPSTTITKSKITNATPSFVPIASSQASLPMIQYSNCTKPASSMQAQTYGNSLLNTAYQNFPSVMPLTQHQLPVPTRYLPSPSLPSTHILQNSNYRNQILVPWTQNSTSVLPPIYNQPIYNHPAVTGFTQPLLSHITPQDYYRYNNSSQNYPQTTYQYSQQAISSSIQAAQNYAAQQSASINAAHQRALQQIVAYQNATQQLIANQRMQWQPPLVCSVVGSHDYAQQNRLTHTGQQFGAYQFQRAAQPYYQLNQHRFGNQSVSQIPFNIPQQASIYSTCMQQVSPVNQVATHQTTVQQPAAHQAVRNYENGYYSTPYNYNSYASVYNPLNAYGSTYNLNSYGTRYNPLNVYGSKYNRNGNSGYCAAQYSNSQYSKPVPTFQYSSFQNSQFTTGKNTPYPGTKFAQFPTGQAALYANRESSYNQTPQNSSCQSPIKNTTLNNQAPSQNGVYNQINVSSISNNKSQQNLNENNNQNLRSRFNNIEISIQNKNHKFKEYVIPLPLPSYCKSNQTSVSQNPLRVLPAVHNCTVPIPKPLAQPKLSQRVLHSQPLRKDVFNLNKLPIEQHIITSSPLSTATRVTSSQNSHPFSIDSYQLSNINNQINNSKPWNYGYQKEIANINLSTSTKS